MSSSDDSECTLEQVVSINIPFYMQVFDCMGVLPIDERYRLLSKEKEFAEKTIGIYFHSTMAEHVARILVSAHRNELRGKERIHAQAMIQLILYIIERNHGVGIVSEEEWRDVGKLLRCSLDLS